MDMTTKPFAASPRHACAVVILRPLDQPRHDKAVLVKAFAGRPQHEAEEMLCSILERIADLLDQLQQGLTADDYGGMGKPARRIRLVAGQIGLTDVAAAAGHIARMAARGDRHALAAVLGRLERAFDVAVTAVWEFRDP